ncbi:helix-turn-helix domain-containing protein [Pseudonocardia sichuanensis]
MTDGKPLLHGAQVRASLAEGKPNTTIQSVQRAVRVLPVVAAVPDGLAAQEVADHFGLALSTSYPPLSTLTGGAVGEAARSSLHPRAGGGRDRECGGGGVRAEPAHLTAMHRAALETGETAFFNAWRLGGSAFSH